MGMSWAEHSVEIEAPIEVAFDAIVDYESFGGWQNAVDRVEVIDRTAEGVGRTVRLFVDAKIRKIDYVLRYSYARPTRIEWDFVEGNGIGDADGHYLFEDLGDRTRATYKFGLEVNLPLPGPVARRAHKSTLKGSVEDLKREAERRAGSEVPAPERDVPAPERDVPATEPDAPAAAATAAFSPASRNGESITGAAGEVVSAFVNLGTVIGSKAVGRASRVLGGITRLRP